MKQNISKEIQEAYEKYEAEQCDDIYDKILDGEPVWIVLTPVMKKRLRERALERYDIKRRLRRL